MNYSFKRVYVRLFDSDYVCGWYLNELSGERRVSERVCVQKKIRGRVCLEISENDTSVCLMCAHLSLINLPISLSGLSNNCRCVFFTLCTLNIIFL